MRTYGLPYQGGKTHLAKRIVDLLPKAEHLYDVFAGGCSVSHAALESGKFDCVHFSDLNDSVLLFRDCLDGNIPDGSEWISREEFYRRKDTDPYVRLVWSFSSNQRDYLYSREIEPYKKALHEMIFASTPNERRLKFHKVYKIMQRICPQVHRSEGIALNQSQQNGYRLPSMEKSESLKISERLQRLKRISGIFYGGGGGG